jgi:predicted ester cyclase
MEVVDMPQLAALESNKERVRTMLEEVWNAGSPERLSEFWAEETRAEAEELHRVLTTAFPDLRITVEDIVAEGDRVVVRLRFRGTHRGPFQGMDPTGRSVEFGAIRIYRLDAGLVTETWAHQDSMGLVRQLRG